MTLGTSGWKIRARLQSRTNVQTCPDANMQAVWVLSVTDDIINGHNGILTPDHAIALSEIMGLIDHYRNQIPVSAVTEVPVAEAGEGDAKLPTEVDSSKTDVLMPESNGESTSNDLSPATPKEQETGVEPSAAATSPEQQVPENTTSATLSETVKPID